MLMLMVDGMACHVMHPKKEAKKRFSVQCHPMSNVQP